jgi:Tol biopolymer transport system component
MIAERSRMKLETRASFGLVLAMLGLAACSSQLIVLGEEAPPAYHFGTPVRIPELDSPAKTDNPSLTADLREIYFTSERTGSAEVWFATRPSRDQAFGAPQLASALNSSTIETSSVISADGLTFWVASDREGGLGDLDVWVSTRPSRDAAWTKPSDLIALNSPAKDIPRPTGDHDRVMPLGSDRDERGLYQIYFASRSGGAGFAKPVHVPELSFERESTVDGFLTDDGLTLFFCSGPAVGPADLYVMTRRSTADPFEARTPLRELNSANDERDPWLSADGSEFYFSSDRSGHYAIYMARVER